MRLKKILGFLFLVLFAWTLIGCDARIVEVSFQTNGGQHIDKIELEQGEILEELPDAIRTGHTFLGWFEDADFTTEFVPTKQILRNITVYAKWQINQYTITIHTDGGPNLEPITANYQTTLTIPEDITKEGYTFLGWYLDSAFTETFQYSRMPAENINIYARWAIDVYTVTFYVGDTVYTTRSVEHGDDITNVPTVPAVVGKTGSWDITDFTNITEDMTVNAVYQDKSYEVVIKDEWGTVYDTQTIVHGNKIVAPSVSPAKEGYIFIGYSEDLSTFIVTEAVEILVTFQIKTFQVQFFGFQGEPLGLQNIVWGGAATAPNISTPDGYTFVGWDKTFDNVTESLMIYAEFSENEFSIVFHAGSGLFSNELNTKTITAAYTSVIGTQEIPQLAGYTFLGWYQNPEFNGEAVVFSAQSTMPLNGLELYAKFQANNYTITFNADGGTVTPATKGVTFDQAIGTLPTPVKTGYTFLHWINSDQEVVTAATIYEAEGNTTFTAVYEIKQYTITFVVDGVTLDTLTVPYQTELNATHILSIPTKTHFTDTAPIWSVDLEGYIVTGNLTVQAMYVANMYTITFDTVGGLPLVDPVTAAYQSTITSPTNPTKEGYSFGGWFVENETEPFVFNKMPGGDITLFALWTEWPVIELVLNGGTGVTSISKAPLSEIQAPTTPTKPGYTFAGWYLDNGTFANSYSFTVMPEEDLTLYAKWNVDYAAYTVQVYYQNIDGLTYPTTPNSILSFQDLTESFVTYTPQAEVGFTFESELSTLSGTVLGNGSLTLEVYYSRNLYQATLNYQDHSATYDETIITLSELIFESQMSFLDNHPGTRTGYTFVEWRDINGNVYDAITEVVGDVELYAVWSLNTYTISGRHIFEKEDLTTHEISSDGDDIIFGDTNVPYGTAYSPVEFFEGYVFLKFSYNGIDYETIEDILTVTENMAEIEVVYRRRILTITFIQNPETAGGPVGIVEDTFQVHYNDSFTSALPTLQYNASSYAATWDRNVFSSLRNDVVVRAMYYEIGVQTVTFMDNGIIRYIATESGENQIITSSSPLWNLTKPGYRFLGWFDQASGGNKLEIVDFLFTNFDETDYVYAQWQTLNAFNAPSAVDVSTNFEDEITIIWTVDPVQIENTFPSGFVVLLNGVELEIGLTDVVINGNQVTLTLTELDDLFTSFQVLLLPGVHTVAIKVLGDNINHLNSTYSESYQYSVDTEIEGEVTDVAIYDYFIVESVEINNVATKRYVFYTGMTYNFSEKYQFEILNGQEFVQANNNQLVLFNQPGNFRFTMAIDGGLPVVYEGRVVKNINQFAVGNNYATYLNQIEEGSDYLKQTTSPYQVGYRNPFYFDLRMIDNNGNRVALMDAMLEYDFYLDGASTPLSKLALEDYVEFLPYNQLQFKPLALGHTFDVVVAPRYQATKMTVNDAEFSFVVNDGYNAFTNQQLKNLFSNLNVDTINIQANIKAELSSNQVNSDGSPRNKYVYANETATLGNVYARVDDQTTNDRFTINGNYMTIDGSDLPYSNKDSGSGVVGYAASFEIINVQVGIFYYNVANLSSSLPEENDNKFTVENLTILGNTSTPQVNYGQSAEEIINQEQLMSKNSGGYLGIVVRNGSSYFENIRVGFTLIAFTNNAYGQDINTVPVHMTLNYVEMFDQWANSMYAYSSTGITILNSKIGQSGGAAIHMVDTRQGNGLANPVLRIDDATEINNWISGDEAWFKAYGMSAIALQLKSQIQTNVAGVGKSIIKNIINPVTGLESERINFIMLTEPSSEAVDDPHYPTSGSEVRLELMTGLSQTNIERLFDFLTSGTNPRIQGGQFMFPVGAYSDNDAFLYALEEAEDYGVSPEQAPSIVYIAGFYNLTVLEAIQYYQIAVGSATPLPIVVEQNKGVNHVLPKYLEINTPVPLFSSGYSVVLLEVFNQSYE